MEPNRYNASPEKTYKYYMREEFGQRQSNPAFHNRNKSFDLILNSSQSQNKGALATSQTIEKCVLSLWGSCRPYPTLHNMNAYEPFTTFKDFNEDIVSIAPSDSHLLIQTNKGKVFVCGRNELNQLGGDYGSLNPSPTILEFPQSTLIEKISVGSDFNFAQSNKGEVFCWGFNMRGQLGVGHFENVKAPVLITNISKVDNNNVRNSRNFMKRSKEISFEMGQDKSNIDPNNPPSENLLGAAERVVDIACGGLHTLALTNRNRIFATGFGDTFALGLEKPQTICTFKEITWFSQVLTYQEPVEKIACGVAHSGCIIGGKVYLWGVLGSGATLHYKKPVHVPQPASTTPNGMYYGDAYYKDASGGNGRKKSEVGTIALDLKLGDLLTVVLTKKGEVYTMGDNTQFQLGHGRSVEIATSFTKVNQEVEIHSIACGSNHVIVLNREVRQVYGWGSNAQGQLMPYLKDEVIENPKQITYLKPALVSKIYGGAHSTFCFSKTLPEFPQDSTKLLLQKEKDNQELSKQKLDNENQMKVNSTLTLENEKQKNDMIAVNMTLSNVEKEKAASTTTIKRGFLSNASTQTTVNDSSIGGGDMFDVMQHFKKKLKIDRTLKPDFEIDFNELAIERRIGEGGFGIIYKARWRESTIAVKVLKPDLMREETIKDFLNECYAMESLRHPNIVMFMGACTKQPNLAIVLEFCSRETLWKLLQNKEIQLNWEDKRRIAIEIARGMNYLHTFSIPVLHRDQKSLNILMDEGFRPKIADFGWTRKMAEKMTGKIGTYQWMAPEVIKSQKYTEKADVFSFAIILWEIASREPPYRNVGGAQVSLDVVNNDLRPTIPKNTPEPFSKLMKRCWERFPEKRPSFKDIIRDIESMKLPKF